MCIAGAGGSRLWLLLAAIEFANRVGANLPDRVFHGRGLLAFAVLALVAAADERAFDQDVILWGATIYAQWCPLGVVPLRRSSNFPPHNFSPSGVLIRRRESRKNWTFLRQVIPLFVYAATYHPKRFGCAGSKAARSNAVTTPTQWR